MLHLLLKQWLLELLLKLTGLNTLVPLSDKLLDLEKLSLCLLKALSNQRLNPTNSIQSIFSQVLITMMLKDFSWKRHAFILGDMDKVTALSSITSLSIMIIFTRHSVLVINNYELKRHIINAATILLTIGQSWLARGV